MTRGMKSSEFAITIACMALCTYLGHVGASDVAVGAVAGLGMAWVGGRSLVKSKNNGAG